ncbi:MAG: hypothetical protein IOD12_05475 [Silvanigrellales bacterium]|nr:hypothetical protein [Silvanigrellales bacterium]
MKKREAPLKVGFRNRRGGLARMGSAAGGLATAFLATGCVTAHDVDSRLQNWRGQSEATLVSRFGAPHRTYDLKDGTRMMTYARERETLRSSPGQHRFRRDPTLYTTTTECTLNFTLDAGRNVSAVSWDGDIVECAALAKPLPASEQAPTQSTPTPPTSR